jgi:hypothetical protein
MTRNNLFLFVVVAVFSFSICYVVSHCKADSCTTKAAVCNYEINPYRQCLNGVASLSIMATGEPGTKDAHTTGLHCGFVWKKFLGVVYDKTTSTCGTGAHTSCI